MSDDNYKIKAPVMCSSYINWEASLPSESPETLAKAWAPLDMQEVLKTYSPNQVEEE